MQKLLITCLIILWAGIGTALATPVLNDGHYVPIQYNGSGEVYGNYVNSGNLMFIAEGNNLGIHFDDLKTQVADYYGMPDFELSLSETVNYNSFDCGYTGIWEVVPNTDTLSFYLIKAGAGYAMYELFPPDYEGSWSTFDLWLTGMYNHGDSLEISHFSAYNQESSNPVPLPTTIILLGSGLLGIIIFPRKRII